MIDCLIVGGGIAGINVAWQLRQSGANFHLVDPCKFDSSTSIAAGLINPITGRKFANQWNIDELMPLVESTYTSMETFLQIKCLFKKQIFKIHKNESVMEDWIKIQSSNEISPYIDPLPNSSKYAKFLDYRFGAIGIFPAFHLHTKILQEHFYKTFADSLIVEDMKYDDLKQVNDHFHYLGNTYRYVIFCDGVAAQSNPWFNFIPFKPAKGECLIIQVPNMELEEIIMKGIMMVPIEKDKYWIGATNTWNDLTTTPTQAAHNELNNGIRALLKLNYTILSQKAAIRPTIKDRTPVVGKHPEISNMFVLNGLGTKGTSLAPFYAKQLVAHIFNGTPINNEVRVNRF